MNDLEKGPELMDRPEILYRLFFPRRENAPDIPTLRIMNHPVAVEEGIFICCRFYASRPDGPSVLYFHGNGETAPDYDFVAPLYRERGISLFVADYRGYGMSNGSPTCSAMIRDAHPIFHAFASFLDEQGHTGARFVMGRSLGSAPAIEVAYHYQALLKGLIVESGFASARNQFARLGVTHLFKDVPDAVGFGNDLKIQKVTIPTLIIHGEWDDIIPAREGQALYELSGAAKKESLFIPEAGHNDLMMTGLDQYMAAIERFTSPPPG